MNGYASVISRSITGGSETSIVFYILHVSSSWDVNSSLLISLTLKSAILRMLCDSWLIILKWQTVRSFLLVFIKVWLSTFLKEFLPTVCWIIKIFCPIKVSINEWVTYKDSSDGLRATIQYLYLLGSPSLSCLPIPTMNFHSRHQAVQRVARHKLIT